MRVVHNTFLFAYGEVPGLIRATPDGDRDRAGFVGQWIADLDATLHVHHESEDNYLWDRLEKRAPTCALHVGQMRAQHAQVAAILEVAAPLLDRWRATADPSVRDELSMAYDELLAVLKVHLRREVVEVVPVAEKVVTRQEWDLMAEHAQEAIPRSRMLPQLGHLLASSPPELAKPFRAALPLPIRLLYRFVGRRQYERQFRELFPERPVPQT